jgi:hypothetical protein
MTTQSTPGPLSATELHRLHDAAHAQAPQLRRQAIAEFWATVAALLRDPMVRWSQRLPAAVRRHPAQRLSARTAPPRSSVAA